MASRALQPPQSDPLDVLLSVIPSLPRAALARLTERLIDRMDAMDPDAEMEDSESSNYLVDDRGRWCPRAPVPDGPWYEDDEEGGDLEMTEEREPELYDGGGGTGAFSRWPTSLTTA